MPDDPGIDEGSPRRNLAPQLAVAAMLGVLGLAVTVQINQVEADEFAVRGVELVELLKSLDAANKRVDDEIEELQRARDDLASSNELSKEAAQQATDQANQLAILAGTAAVTGPGVTLTIEDPGAVIDAALLLDVIQELRDGGAEAIAINGTARVIAQTYFADEDGEIRVGGRKISPPYVIEVIGDPETLEEGAEFRGGVLDRLHGRGAQGSIERMKEITITALAETRTPEYARGDS